jgi:hypothetical protein
MSIETHYEQTTNNHEHYEANIKSATGVALPRLLAPGRWPAQFKSPPTDRVPDLVCRQ